MTLHYSLKAGAEGETMFEKRNPPTMRRPLRLTYPRPITEILRLLQSGEVDKKDLISAIATLAEGVSKRV
jgi:hypothetical protein